MADEIEFLDAEPAEGDEERLPEPAPRRLPGSSGSRRIALVVVAIVLGGGTLILRAATGDTPDGSEASATAAPTARPSEIPAPRRSDSVAGLSTPVQIFCRDQARFVPAGAPSAASSSGPSADLDPRSIDGLVTCDPHDVANCRTGPASANCTTTGEIPMQVVDAVRESFPGARYLASNSQVRNDPPRLWYRYVQLDLPDDHLTVQVLIQQRSGEAGFSGNLDNGTKLIVRSVHSGADLTTIVQVTGPSGARPDDAVAASLAADRRLVAVG